MQVKSIGVLLFIFKAEPKATLGWELIKCISIACAVGTTGSISPLRGDCCCCREISYLLPFCAQCAVGLKPLSLSGGKKSAKKRPAVGFWLIGKRRPSWEGKSFSWQWQSRSINFTLSTKIKQDPAKSFCDFCAAFCIVGRTGRRLLSLFAPPLYSATRLKSEYLSAESLSD